VYVVEEAPTRTDTAPVVLLHAAATSGNQWRGVRDALAGEFRLLVPDLCGDGRSGRALPPPGVSLLPREIDAIRAAIDVAGGTAHLVGHSYGALLALRFALQQPQRVASLLVFEPIAFDLLAAEGDAADAQEIERLRSDCEEAVGQGDLERAAERFVDYWARPGTFAAMPPAQRSAVAGSMRKVALGWGEITRTPTDYARVEVSATILTASHSPRPLRWIARRLAERVRRSRVVELSPMGHLAPVTHPRATADAIRAHLTGRAFVEE
jgi:pimeloyl-ACP methyl ester carboxylesterase